MPSRATSVRTRSPTTTTGPTISDNKNHNNQLLLVQQQRTTTADAPTSLRGCDLSQLSGEKEITVMGESATTTTATTTNYNNNTNHHSYVSRVHQKMGEELPILKGILNGVVNYHNAPVRFGRVPKREKARIMAAMAQNNSSRTTEKLVVAELEDVNRLLETVRRAHTDTCDFTRDKIEPLLARAREQPSYTACPPISACPLNPNPQPLTGQQEMLQDFSKRFSPTIKGVVEFAKRIPGFTMLAQDDQVTLLKAGVFEVLLVRLACMFDTQTATMLCLNGQVLRRDSIHSSNARFLMDSMFNFAEHINNLNLSDPEVGLFCSVVVTAPDRPGLRNTELIEKMQNKLKAALQILVSQNHHNPAHILDELMKKVPDLRTLNTLHSEKLLAFKMTEQQLMMQQQQQVYSSPLEDEVGAKCPHASSWSSSSDVTMEDAKSPISSVSSTESMCSSEITSLNDYHQIVNNHHIMISPNVTNAPLLAATLAGGLAPHRHRANSGSTSSGDDELAATSHLVNNGLTITPVPRPHKTHAKFRKLDSPDSGIESGTEKVDKSSAPPSLCSSPPRSSLEDHHIVEDMPVLKRVLQAPPLYDTNSLMDEAYKPHKKFRALRQKDSAEAEPVIVMSPQPPPAPVHSQLHMQLTAPPTQQSSLSSTHSTLAKSLMEGPRMTAEQMKRTDIIHNFIMRDDHNGSSPMVTASPTSCPYKVSNSSLLQPAWATSVITTTSRHQQQHNMHNHTNRGGTSSPSSILLHHQTDYNGSSRLYLHPQSPHSTSPAPSRSPATMCSPQSSSSPPLLSATKIIELQLDIADSQQPLNLSKKSPSPSPRPMRIVTLEV